MPEAFTVDASGATSPQPDGQLRGASDASPSHDGAGQFANADSHGTIASPVVDQDLIASIQELQVRRKHHIKTTNRLTNAGGALVRRALGWTPDAKDAEKIKGRAAKLVAQFLAGKVSDEDSAAIGALNTDLMVLSKQVAIATEARSAIELDMKRNVRKLPAYAWVKDVKGLGELGFAVIIGEAGDLAKYSKVDKLWKRLGLAPLNGHAMSSWKSGKPGKLTADEWTVAGYSPRRLAEIFSCVTASLIKHQIRNPGVAVGPYGEVWVKRRLRTAETHPDWTKGHSSTDAGRVMTKALVSGLWSEWRRASGTMPETVRTAFPASTLTDTDISALIAEIDTLADEASGIVETDGAAKGPPLGQGENAPSVSPFDAPEAIHRAPNSLAKPASGASSRKRSAA